MTEPYKRLSAYQKARKLTSNARLTAVLYVDGVAISFVFWLARYLVEPACTANPLQAAA